MAWLRRLLCRIGAHDWRRDLQGVWTSRGIVLPHGGAAVQYTCRRCSTQRLHRLDL